MHELRQAPEQITLGVDTHAEGRVPALLENEVA